MATPSDTRRECIVCRAQGGRVVFQEFGVDIVRCSECGHVYSTHELPADYDEYFGDEVPEGQHFYWDAAHRPMYEAFGEQYLKGRRGRLLDLGCGLGFFVRFVANNYPWEALGVETSAAAVKFARETLGLQSVFHCAVNEASFPDQHFDVICLWDVIEHLADPGPLLMELSRLLKNDGVLFLHTPNVHLQLPKARIKRLIFGMDPGRHYLEARDHLNLYSMKTLERVLARAGFDRVRFVHLPPIQSVAGSTNPILRWAKNSWYHAARTLGVATRGKLNLDNLLAEARKHPSHT